MQRLANVKELKPAKATRPEDYFVALSECHFMNEASMGEISYYPGFERWWKSIDGVMRAWADRDLHGGGAMPPPRAHALIKYMDEAGMNPRGPHAVRVLDGRTDFTREGLMAAAYDPYLTAFARLIPGLAAAYEAAPAGDPLKARVGLSRCSTPGQGKPVHMGKDGSVSA